MRYSNIRHHLLPTINETSKTEWMRLVYVSNHFGTIKDCLWRNNHHFPSLVRQAISPASYSDKTPKALVTLVESVDSSFYGDPSHPSMWANIKQWATHLYSWGRTHRKPKAQCWQAICKHEHILSPWSHDRGPSGPTVPHSTSFLRTWPTWMSSLKRYRFTVHGGTWWYKRPRPSTWKCFQVDFI